MTLLCLLFLYNLVHSGKHRCEFVAFAQLEKVFLSLQINNVDYGEMIGKMAGIYKRWILRVCSVRDLMFFFYLCSETYRE